MSLEKAWERKKYIWEEDSLEPSGAVGVKESECSRRTEGEGTSSEGGSRHETAPPKKRGRPRSGGRIRVVRIDPGKYPAFQGDREHPFASMCVEARIKELDSFCARLWARVKKDSARVTGHRRPAAA